MQGQSREVGTTKSQSDMECKESMQDLITEAKELWDRVWAYCADCGEKGNVSLPCKTCYREEPNNRNGYLSWEEGYSSREEHCKEQLFTNHSDKRTTGMNLISQWEDVGDCGETIYLAMSSPEFA